MRLSDLSRKEIIDLESGERMGNVGESDLEINPETGEISAIILAGSSFFGWGKRKQDVIVPWSAILKIGPETMIINLSQESHTARR